MTDHPLFDFAESIRHRDNGIELAAENNARLVVEAREIAVEIARQKGTVTADDVISEMVKRKLCRTMGNSMGGVFKDRRFRWTGRRIKSGRIHAHANEIKVWALV